MSRILLALILCCASESFAKEPPQGHVQIVEHTPKTQHPTIGPRAAPVTIEFFVNIGNARSARPHGLLMDLAARHPERLRVIYLLTERRERSSNLAQGFGREAFEQGRFFEFLDAYYGENERPPASKDYPDVARAAGVNYERVQESLDSMRYDEVLNANHYYWKRMHLAKVPALLINGRPVTSISSLDKLEELYDAAYEEALALMARGVPQSALYQRFFGNSRAELERRSPTSLGPLDDEPIENPPKSPMPIRMTELLQGKHRQGPAYAKVTAVFICHMQSLLCRAMSRHLETILSAYPDEVQLIFRPLFDSERTQQDKAGLMYEAALCADQQGAFWDFYQHAFDHQRRVNFDQGLAVELAASPALDLDVARFESCLDAGEFTDEVEREVAAVRKTGVQHTPALAIGGLLYSGRLHFEDLRLLIDAELAPGVLETLSNP